MDVVSRLILEDGVYETEAGSTVVILGGQPKSGRFNWFDEENACFECEADSTPVPDIDRLLLTWGCNYCEGGCAELKMVGGGDGNV